MWQGVIAAVLGADRGRGLITRHSFELGDLVMCVQPAAIVQGEADEQPDPEYLVPELLAAARQPKVLAALTHLYDGTGGASCARSTRARPQPVYLFGLHAVQTTDCLTAVGCPAVIYLCRCLKAADASTVCHGHGQPPSYQQLLPRPCT